MTKRQTFREKEIEEKEYLFGIIDGSIDNAEYFNLRETFRQIKESLERFIEKHDKRLIEEIESKLPKKKDCSPSHIAEQTLLGFREGYNICISDIKKILSNL